MIQATSAHTTLVADWLQRFEVDCGLPQSNISRVEKAQERIDQGLVHLWHTAEAPVSMAAFVRETANSRAISWVYTPDELRGKGYASAAVAALSQKALDGGKTFCTLFTDMANPTSNDIYAKVGYRPYSDSQHFRFVDKAAERSVVGT